LRLREAEEEVDVVEGPFDEGETPEVMDPFCTKQRRNKSWVSTGYREGAKTGGKMEPTGSPVESLFTLSLSLFLLCLSLP